MADTPPTGPSPSSPPASLREQSLSTLRTAILSPSDPGQTMSRANTVLGLYFDPDVDVEARANMRAEFVLALSSYPEWAMHRAFDMWVKRHKRRPSPGEIAILAEAEVRPFADEVKRRVALNRIEPPRPDRVTPAAAQSILAEFGFTEERLSGVLRAKHWTDAVPAGQEGNPEAIRKAREEAGL